MESRKCEFCGADFVPHRENQKFCSKECSGRYYNARTYKRDGAEPLFTIELECPICKEKFSPKTRWQKYCSAECRMARKRAKRAEQDAAKRALKMEEKKKLAEAAHPGRYQRYRTCGDCGSKFLPVGKERTCPYCIQMRKDFGRIRHVKVHNSEAYTEKYTFKDMQRAEGHREKIRDIAAEAGKAGMSYGQYVAMMERNKNEQI